MTDNRPQRAALLAHPEAPGGRLAMVGVLLAALRPRQWIKNLLVFAGLVYSLNLTNTTLAWLATGAFVLFCALSSAGYLFNDLIDLAADRQHPLKAHRPLAAGRLSTAVAWATAAILALGGLLAAWQIRPSLAGLALLYLALTVSYSLWLKHVVLVDVLAIAGGFVVRAAAGAVAIGVPISPWLYVCTVLGSLLIALGKRRHELVLLETTAASHRRALDEYSLPLLDQFLVIVGSASIMAYSLYTFSADNLPQHHTMMLTIPFVLYGIFRYLYLVQHRGKGGSPEDLLLEDRPLLLAASGWAVASLAILYLSAR